PLLQAFGFRLSAFSVSAFSPVLFVTDLFHPVDGLAVQRSLNGDVSHRGRRRSAMPMLFTRRNPDHVTWPNLLDRPAPTLCKTAAGRDDQRLTQWMCMPGSASTRLESDTCATNTRRFGCLKQRANSYGTRKPISWPFVGRL